MEETKKFSRSYILLSALYVVLGIVLLLWPTSSVQMICYTLGFIMVVLGITYGILYFTKDRLTGVLPMDLVIGIICLAFGAFILLNPEFLASVMPFAMGIILLLGAVVKIQSAVNMKRLAFQKWYLVLLMAFVITCCMLLFFNALAARMDLVLTEENVSMAAKLTFGNIMLLSLACTVIDSSKVDQNILKSTGAHGVIQKGQGVQVVYGPQVNVIKTDLEAYLAALPAAAHADAAPAAQAEPEQPAEPQAPREPVATITLGSPLAGEALSITACPDAVFAQKMMGDGACVVPATGELVAPCDAKVAFVFDTKHAVGLELPDGTGILCHVGIDTVKLGGKGFTACVAQGDEVKRGDTLLTFDLDYIRANAPSVSTPVLVTATDGKHEVRQLAFGQVNQGDDLLAVDIFEA